MRAPGRVAQLGAFGLQAIGLVRGISGIAIVAARNAGARSQLCIFVIVEEGVGWDGVVQVVS